MLSASRRLDNWRFIRKCGDVWTVLLALTIIILVLLFLATFVIKYVDYVQIIYVDTRNSPKFVTSTNFLSIGLDSIVIAEGLKNFNTTDRKLIRTVRHLSPAFLRIGGNLADKLYFNPDDVFDRAAEEFYCNNFNESNIYQYHKSPNYTMTGSQWLALTNFATVAGLDVIFDLNSLIRFQNGSWDHRNAESLIGFSNHYGLRLNWELGNEPNAYPHKFYETVNASQLAQDFIVLRKILKKYSLYKDSLLVGPDVDRVVTKHNEDYLSKFIKGGGSVVDVLTWHQYYVNSRTTKPEDFLNPDIFDTLGDQIRTIRQIVINESHLPHKPIWLGETASAYGGGAPNLSDTYIGTFIWVDKLGLTAKMGIKGLIRQSIFRGYYALLDKNYDPNPDWWISLLYKVLVGTRVLHYTTIGLPSLRLYVHCTKTYNFREQTAITIFGVNLNNSTARVRIEGYFPQEFDYDSIVYAFELTSDGSLFSKNIKLNGKLLKLLPNQVLPVLMPRVLNVLPYITVPPLSTVFWVIPSPHAKVCS